MDPRFIINTLAQTPFPNTTIFLAMHQDYSEDMVSTSYSEGYCGRLVVKRLLNGGRGHYGPLEHPHITLNVGYFPHSVIQQIRTHRVGVSFDVQSNRYTGNRFLAVVRGELNIEDVIYLRPPGKYTNRVGDSYLYSKKDREKDLELARTLIINYVDKVLDGCPYEMARIMAPFDVRQHFVVTFNVRSLMHMMDLRAKKDAQLECQWFTTLLGEKFKLWCPEIWEWYKENRLYKGRLAP